MMRDGKQGKGLEELCRIARGNRVLEIGSCLGDSAAIFSCYFAEVYCVDLWGQELRAADMPDLGMTNEEIEKAFDAVVLRAGNICKVKMASPGASGRFPDKFFDLVYIDGSHDYQSVIADIRAWKPKAIHFIGGHDFCDEGDVCRAVVDEFMMPQWLFQDSSWMVRV